MATTPEFPWFECLGVRRANFQVVVAHLPRGIEGLLGLDFLRGHRLLLDFREGVLEFD